MFAEGKKDEGSEIESNKQVSFFAAGGKKRVMS